MERHPRSRFTEVALGAAALSILAAGCVNLLGEVESSFDDSIDGWVPAGNVLLRHAARVGCAAQGALEVIVDRSGPYADNTRTARATTRVGSDGVPVTPGTTLHGGLTIMARGALAKARCEIRFFAEDARLTTATGPLVEEVDSAWIQTRCDGVAPEGATHAALRVHLEGADYGQVHYVDEAWLSTTPAPANACADVTPNAPPPPPPSPACGDGACDPDETCGTCAEDCGVCPVTPPPPVGDYGPMPTFENTGPTGALTDLHVSAIEPGVVYRNRRIIGGEWHPFPDQRRQAWTWTFENCAFEGNIKLGFVGPDGTGGVYADQLPVLNLTNVSARSIVISSPVVLNVDRGRFLGDGGAALYVHSGNWAEYADWRHQRFPLTITNSFFYAPYLPQPHHTEVWFSAGYVDGAQLTNVTFYQQTGPLAGSGVTAITNIHFGPGTLARNFIRGGYFDFAYSPTQGGAPSPTYANIMANRGQLELTDVLLAQRGNGYFSKGSPDEDVSKYTFTRVRDLDSGHLLAWDGAGLSDTGSP